MSTVAKSSPAYRGQAIYGRGFLPAYDAPVYGFNSPYRWRCPLPRLVAHYDAHLSAELGRHFVFHELEVVGTMALFSAQAN